VSAERRDRTLLLAALGASAVLALAYLAAGGSSYAPAKVQDPCKHRPWGNPEGIQALAARFSIAALDGAACELGVSRERLARALATPRRLERFARRYRIGDARLAKAVQAGLLRAVDDAEEAGVLSPFIGEPLREALRRLPLAQAIELIRNARSLLGELRTFLGPAARSLLEEFLP
jgi:hypothetical protein